MALEINFLDELIQQAEQKEEQQTEAYFDLLLLAVKKLSSQIEYNFHEAEKECSMINNFVLHKNTQLQERIKWLELKLEAFIRERGEKTIALPNGTLKMHKKPDKVEIEDLELFLKKAKPEMLTVVPEQVKPDLNKIKAYIKTKPVPAGIKLIEGKEEFSYKLNGEESNGRKKETGARTEQEPDLRAVV
ncbi:MAG: hypothetical protein HND40_06620 [Ignavibacteriota bacterium]|nr:hypothetical protein [Ignavibacteriaceae bacterium]MCO6446232.1 host-nuclease inhibitor Gam family protein [Ignavibacterium album]MDT3696776.1 host-nuclease inhibitor Gam family protein [Ignavibacterium sp.]MEB2297407.1 host-nuclease inhibitor Gam family protein [Ignavibacteria bacterium]QKJ99253.1 MAG: hypothetical protein HND40_06620 [Ignavibacteriota bacterium]